MSNGTRRRWWTGRDWGDHVSPPVAGPSARPAPLHTAPAAPAAATAATAPRARIRVPWLRLFGFILIAGLAIFALSTGQLLQSLNVFSGEITFYSATGAAGADRQTVESGQPTITEHVREKKTTAQNKGPQHPLTPADATLAGSWVGDDQFGYTISQYGTEVVIVEQSAYGVTAVCTGTVDGDQIELAFEAIDGSTGTGRLTLTDQHTLTGQFVNSLTQQTGDVTMRR